ncbi:Phosphate transporter, partial [Fasciola gigantica]
GACIWLLVATFFRLPVSGTHSIVGATVGFSLVASGLSSIQWVGLIKIVASWFISPLLSGVTSVVMFYLLRRLVLTKDDPLEPGLRLLPAFYGTVVFVNSFSVFYEGPPMLHFDKIPVYGVFIISTGLGCFTLLLVKFCIVPQLRRRILDANPNRSTWSSRMRHKITQRIRWRMSVTKLLEPKVPHPVSILQASETAQYEPQPAENDINRGKLTTVEMQVLQSRASRKQSSQDPSEEPNSILHRTMVTDSIQSRHSSGSNTLCRESSELLATDAHSDVHVAIRDSAAPTSISIKDRPSEVAVFSFLQILSAVFGSFAHGGNDVSNAIGPLIGLWIVGVTQQIDSKMPTPIWILLYGGLGIAIGLWVWGRRVIQTLGEDLTIITPSSGVCIEVGAALTVLVASKIGLPISTTHCKVGSVVGVGRARSKDNVNWGIFRNILIAWLVTLPASGVISALVMYALIFVT